MSRYLKRFVVTLAVILISVQVAWADISISVERRAKNRHPGYCMWCAIQTAAQYQKIEKLNTLVDDISKAEPIYEYRGNQLVPLPKGPANPFLVKWELEQRKIKFRMQEPGVKDLKLIEEAIKAGKPVVVGVRDFPIYGELHAILVTDFSTKNATYIDSNNVKYDYQPTRDWFNKYWTGFVLVLDE